MKLTPETNLQTKCALLRDLCHRYCKYLQPQHAQRVFFEQNGTYYGIFADSTDNNIAVIDFFGNIMKPGPASLIDGNLFLMAAMAQI